ncbi:MAG: AbrB/MazE/SpoVT family DNA-binding domain-containing protein [Promethearchaeota archaeon]
MTQTLKEKYERSIIKLGNSKAITFPQEWTNSAKLEEKSQVTLYPIDNKTLVVRAHDKEKPQTIFRLDSAKWPIRLVKQAIISAFKLNIDEIYLKYNSKNQDDLYALLIDLRKEIIGLDFKNLSDNSEFFINFLLDASKTNLNEVFMDLANVFTTIINNIISGTVSKNNDLLLAEIDRKYSLGTRILITGLTDYPISRGYQNLPIIRFLGDRVILLYTRDFINETLTLQHLNTTVIQKYSKLLKNIPRLLIEIIKNYSSINFDSILKFQESLTELTNNLDSINFIEKSEEEHQIRNSILYFLNSFKNFFDIGITRMIETEIGIA